MSRARKARQRHERQRTSETRRLRWLHISDLQMRSKEPWESRPPLTALVRLAEDLRRDGPRPDAVFVSGDIAHSGTPDEYDHALGFLGALASALELDPRERFFVVPGNHDVDQDRIGPADARILADLEDEAAVGRLIGHLPTLRLLGERLSAFRAFTEELLGPARAWRRDQLGRADVFEVDGLRAGVLQLDSTWARGAEPEFGTLLVGEAQVRRLLAQTRETDLRIALMHHPYVELRDWDAARVRKALYKRGGASVVLRGHLHRSGSSVRTAEGHVAVLVAGAAHTRRPWPVRILLGDVDLEEGKSLVHVYEYEGRGPWTRRSPDGQRGGAYPFDLPFGCRASADVRPDGEPARLHALYREVAANTWGSAAVGLITEGRRAAGVRVQDLFVPLTLARSEQRLALLSTDELAHRLLPRPAEGTPARFVVLGAPGSGKTTLCRYLTVLFAGETTLPDLDVSPSCQPLYVDVGRYGRCSGGRAMSLVEFLQIEARERLSLPVPPRFVEAQLRAGHSVVLIDGLDELDDPSERRNMRDRIAGFCARWPDVPVIVTSRVAGYAVAPLPEGAGGFERLTLLPFGSQSLDRFVRDWYAVQEPDDATRRNRRIVALLKALRSDADLRGLSRNPLMATIIALAHRDAAWLPAQRARLAELCIRTLLETWPAEVDRRFPDLDEGLQRHHLEELALWLQERRTDSGHHVVVPQGELLSVLAGSLASRCGPGGARGVAERWLTHLMRLTGLLVEDSPGVLGFNHLMLMEYLAACAWDRREGDGLATAIAARVFDGGFAWAETALLAIGRRALDPRFTEALSRAIDPSSLGGAVFLLGATREGASLPAATLEAALRTSMAQAFPLFVSEQLEPTRALLTSRRHGAAVSGALHAIVDDGNGPELAGALLVLEGKHRTTALERLLARADADTAMASILRFEPLGDIGELVHTHCGMSSLLHAQVHECPESARLELALRSFAAGRPRAARSAAAALAACTLTSAHAAAAQEATVSAPECRWPVPVTPRAPLCLAPPRAAIAESDAWDGVGGGGAVARRLLTLDASQLRSHDVFASAELAARLGTVAPRPSWTSPAEPQEGPPEPGRVPEAASPPVRPTLGELALEHLAAAAATIGLPEPDRARLALRREQSRELWAADWVARDLDGSLRSGDPDSLALYLALGWTQAVFTWQWPPSERWSRLLSGGAPAHFWPRLHWHLCWLVHTPTDPRRQAAVRQAIDDGLTNRDPELRLVAELFDSWWRRDTAEVGRVGGWA